MVEAILAALTAGLTVVGKWMGLRQADAAAAQSGAEQKAADQADAIAAQQRIDRAAKGPSGKDVTQGALDDGTF